VAAISGPGNGFPGEVVSFDASGSQPGSSPIASFSWSFGDGASAGPSTNAQASTIYNHSGTYQVTVTVTDENGQSGSASTQVNVQARLDTAVWTLDNIDNQMLVPGTTITLQFLNGQVAGFGGCNSYNGTYSATDNGDGTYSVQVTQTNNTQMACPEDVMRQEQRYFEILRQVTTAQIQGNYLVLASPVGTLAFYEVGSPMPR
jgi:heat shock protein HslJ